MAKLNVHQIGSHLGFDGLPGNDRICVGLKLRQLLRSRWLVLKLALADNIEFAGIIRSSTRFFVPREGAAKRRENPSLSLSAKKIRIVLQIKS